MTLVEHGHDVSGPTSARPTNAEVGQRFFDTTLGAYLVWNGDSWQEAGDAATGEVTAGSITGGDASLGINGLAGTASDDDTPGGDGGDVAVAGAAGGANTGGADGEAGGAGGDATVTGGAGGDTNSTGAHDGGSGGDVTVTSGDGGDASAGTGDGGAGGDITLAPGSGGTSAGGDAGAPGKVKSGGLFFFADAQVIDMADDAVVLTRVPGSPAGTLLTSNVLAVDANSGATEDLTLPPEADCACLLLLVRNTGGESIVVKDDGGGTVDTVATAEFGLFFCDGTAWAGMNQA